MRPVEDILSDIGIREFNQAELVEIAEKYKKALLDGLEGKSELPMYPSFLYPTDPKKLPQGKSAIIIEIGGSHAYGGIATVTDTGVTIIKSHRADLPTRTYESVPQFFTVIADLLAPLLEGATADAIGIVYAHPATSIKRDVGNDATIDSLSKEFVIPGITEAPLGELLRKHMGEKYPYLRELPTAVMNDTVAVLLANGAPIGGAVATGMNIAVATPKSVINTESGDFKGVPESVVSNQVIQQSERPEHHPAEKNLSGLYLPEFFKIGIQKLQEAGHDVPMPEGVDAAVMSGYVEREVSGENEKIYQQLAKTLMKRSADIIGAMVAGALMAFPPEVNPVEIPIEGSLFWGAPGYVDVATKVASETSGKTVKFVNIPHAGRVGAGVAALGTLLQ